MGDGLDIARPPAGQRPGALPVIDRDRDAAGLGQVVGDGLGRGLGDLGEVF